MPQQLNARSRLQRLKSIIYVGKEPYCYPPFSQSAVVYGRLPSMKIMEKWVDDGEPVLETVRLGCGSIRDQLTADYATVLCGTLTEEEAAHIEMITDEPDSKSPGAKSFDVKVVVGSSKVDVALGTSQRFKTLSLDTSKSGNEAFLSTREDRRGTSDRHLSGIGYTAHRSDNYTCQHNFPRFTEVSDITETRFSGNSGAEVTYRTPARLSNPEINAYDADNRRTNHGTNNTVLNLYDYHNPENSTARYSDTFQQIIARESTKLAAAYDVWTLKAADSEAARLMLKEIGHFHASHGNLPYAVAPLDMQLNLWKISVEGPACTPYEGGIFEIEIDIGLDWQDIKCGGKPVTSVSDIEGCGLKILTQIIHPDITTDGKARNLESIYALVGFNLDLIAKTFIDMLLYPERVPKYLAAKPELAELAKNQPDIFDTIARHWTQEHAMSGKPSEPIVYGRLR